MLNSLNDKKQLRRYTYLSGFLFTLHLAFASYINSSFIAELIGENIVGLFFVLASLATIVALAFTPLLVKTFNYKPSILLLTIINLILVIPIIFYLKSTLLALSALFFYYIIGFVLKYILDLYLENLSSDEDTGGIRGIFLTLANFGWVLSPLAIGLVLGNQNNYYLIYILSALTLLPFAFTVYFTFKSNYAQINSKVIPPSLFFTVKQIWSNQTNHDRNLHNVMAVDFILNFFYAFMVIYMPIYLHEYIGLPWSDIGLIFTIMLLPFVLFQYPLGWLADHKLGEKEIMGTGLIIAGLATLIIPFLTTTSLIWWAIILFITRVGAASIEISKESYLFKKITANDSNILSISRMMLPLAYIIGPLSATIFLFFVPFNFLFIFLGFVVLYGLRYSLILIDTK